MILGHITSCPGLHAGRGLDRPGLECLPLSEGSSSLQSYMLSSRVCNASRVYDTNLPCLDLVKLGIEQYQVVTVQQTETIFIHALSCDDDRKERQIGCGANAARVVQDCTSGW